MQQQHWRRIRRARLGKAKLKAAAKRHAARGDARDAGGKHRRRPRPAAEPLLAAGG
jgi:hypothetical protein